MGRMGFGGVGLLGKQECIIIEVLLKIARGKLGYKERNREVDAHY